MIMQKPVRILVAGLALSLIVTLVTIMTITAATASDGVAPRMRMCSIRSNRAAVRHRTTALMLDPTDALYRSALMYHRAKMYYRWCKNGQYTDTVEFLSFGWCSEKRDNAEVPYVRGVKWNLVMADRFHHRTGPPSDSRSWPMFAGNGGDWRCKLQDFADSDWYFRNEMPFWIVDAWVDIQGQPDDNIDFPGIGPSRLHYLGYSADPRVS